MGNVRRIKLEGKQLGEWKVLEYVGKNEYKCQCSCGVIKNIKACNLNNGSSKSCGHLNIIDLKDKTFGELHVIEYDSNGYWKCQCSCGKITYKSSKGLRSGQSVSCGHTLADDLRGQQFGELKALEYKGKHYWKCICSCGNEKIARKDHLVKGRITSCGHKARMDDITGHKFNEWKVIKYCGNSHWKCQCSCGKIKEVSKYNLISGRSKSCGHTNLERLSKLCLIDRDDKMISALKSEESLREFVGNNAITYKELSNKLGITYSYCVSKVHKLQCNDLIKIISYTSKYEDEIIDFIKNTCNIDNIVKKDRKILSGKELDIYIPEKNIAIEFNGNYWHSSYEKSKTYHQEKTIACAKQKIRLIHIFEYEWINIKSKNIIKNILYNALVDNAEKINDIVVRNIDKETAYEFEDIYNLKGSAESEINIGCFSNNELIGVMSFGTSRFNRKYSYEILRCTFKNNIRALGAKEKIFKYFLNKYKTDSIITYIDISKFTGNSYIALGFRAVENYVMEPNYVWVSTNGKTVLSEHELQKSISLKNNKRTIDITEDEVMNNLNFLKIYDSGNIKLEWRQ